MKSGNKGDGWLTGRLDFNRGDKRAIIKRPQARFGYTMDLGNKWTWIVNVAFVVIMVVLAGSL